MTRRYSHHHSVPQAEGADLLMYRLDLYFKTDPELAVITHQFASSEALFLSELSQAWTLLMNADMFDGPRGNLCVETPQPQPSHSSLVQVSTVSLLLSLSLVKLF